jgi:transcriptional regulator with XRE-family HTH domain
MFDKKVFSERLVFLRNRKGVMAKDVAATIGITKPSLSQLESGLNSPSLNTLLSLADFFGTSTDYLLGRVDNP